MKLNDKLCWDGSCVKGKPICCFDCWERLEGCKEACDQLGCREKMKGDEDEKED